MKKKYAIAFLLIAVFALAGCASKNESKKVNSNNQNKTQPATTTQENIIAGEQQWSENFTEASSTILAVGDKVFVMGSENIDGSISAERIIVVNSDTNWEELTKNMITQQKVENGSQTGQAQPTQGQAGDSGQNGQFQPPQGGQGSAPADFKTLSDEEKQAMMAKRATQGGIGGRPAGGTMQSMTQVNGEIISKDNSSFTLKIENGGSKLIFFSDSSKILKPKQAN